MDSINIDNKFHLCAISALTSFIEKTGFEDFRYTINETFSGNVTCYELSLLDNQNHSLLDIRVKTIRHSCDDYHIEVETNGETLKVDKITTDSIMKAISKSMEAYVTSKIIHFSDLKRAITGTDEEVVYLKPLKGEING